MRNCESGLENLIPSQLQFRFQTIHRKLQRNQNHDSFGIGIDTALFPFLASQERCAHLGHVRRGHSLRALGPLALFVAALPRGHQLHVLAFAVSCGKQNTT